MRPYGGTWQLQEGSSWQGQTAAAKTVRKRGQHLDRAADIPTCNTYFQAKPGQAKPRKWPSTPVVSAGPADGEMEAGRLLGH